MAKGLALVKIGDKYRCPKQKVDYILKNKNYIGVSRKKRMILLLK
ncbi:hypothetical protein [Paraclostridium sordellii]|nr:hypothetical protein [Paeniclostridium sordellii]